jgi:endonuclease/exonuclease/phosphatase family metal-dependent hydrolase
VAGFVASLAGLALVIVTSGCASNRPVSVSVEHQAVTVPTSNMERGPSLKLVTYNIWGLPSWMTGAPSGRYPRIARELERLDPDIILLQEAWTAKARKAAPANGHWSIARAAGQHTFFQQSGLVTLSKYPIIGGEFYPFSRAAFPDRFVNKGVLKVTVRLPGGPVVNIWNVHLQADGPPEIRLSQVRELESHVQAAEDGQIADVVGGDFNCTPESSICHELETQIGPNVQQLGGVDPFVTWDGLSAKPGAGQTIDYIFIRARTTFPQLQAVPHMAFAAASQAQRLSDHFGIEVVVNLSSASSLVGPVGPLVPSPPFPANGTLRTVFTAGSISALPRAQSGLITPISQGLGFQPVLEQ